MKTEIIFYDSIGNELGEIEEEEVNCCTGDLIWMGDNEENWDLQEKSFIVTKAVYDFNNRTRRVEARQIVEGNGI